MSVDVPTSLEVESGLGGEEEDEDAKAAVVAMAGQ